MNDHIENMKNRKIWNLIKKPAACLCLLAALFGALPVAGTARAESILLVTDAQTNGVGEILPSADAPQLLMVEEGNPASGEDTMLEVTSDPVQFETITSLPIAILPEDLPPELRVVDYVEAADAQYAPLLPGATEDIAIPIMVHAGDEMLYTNTDAENGEPLAYAPDTEASLYDQVTAAMVPELSLLLTAQNHVNSPFDLTNAVMQGDIIRDGKTTDMRCFPACRCVRMLSRARTCCC